MRITFSHRMVAVVTGAAIVAGVQVLAAAAGAAASAATATASTAGEPARVAIQQDAVSTVAQAAAVRYWTPARMAAARRTAGAGTAPPSPATKRPRAVRAAPAQARRPAGHPVSRERHLVKKAEPKAPAAPQPWRSGDTAGQGLRWTHGGAVTGAVGKVYFTLDDEDYVCSGTLVGRGQADVVLTAAHCVTGGLGPGSVTQWATNWMFVPGFGNGRMPYGEYTARRFFATPDWTGPDGGSEQYDVAFVRVTAATLYGKTGPARPPTGLPVEFTDNQDAVPTGRAYVFGYPAEAPYDGLALDYCAGPVTASGGSLRTPCAMTAGDSGGPWLAGFDPRSGAGTVAAVCTYKVTDNLRVLYGAVLGPQARDEYQRAVRSAG
ncbi:MAG TPA: serine protease [Trebonia sp.]